MVAPKQLSLLTKSSSLTHCYLDLITLHLLQTRTPSRWAEISLIPAGSTSIDREQVPPERSPGTQDSPHNSIYFPPLTSGKDAAAKSLGRHSQLLHSSRLRAPSAQAAGAPALSA